MRKVALVFLTCAAVAVLVASYVVQVRAQAGDTFQVEATPNRLWPPDGRMVPIHLGGYCDWQGSGGCNRDGPCECCEAISIVGISGNEPIQEGVDYAVANNTCPSGSGRSVPKLWLKATRAGSGGGRTYSINFRECRPLPPPHFYCCARRIVTVAVTVPHDQRER